MPTYGNYAFCTREDMERRMSVEGVRLRADDDDDGAVSLSEEDVINDCISEATETVLYYCWAKYAPSVLALSPWVNRKATDLSCYALFGVRGNPVPEGVLVRAERAEALLKEVRDGAGLIPNAALLRRLAPRVSNTRVDPRYQFRCIRVDRKNSNNPQGVEQIPDYLAEYTFEL